MLKQQRIELDKNEIGHLNDEMSGQARKKG